MHNQFSPTGLTWLIVAIAFVAFVIIILAILVKQFGLLKTFVLGFGLFFVGLIGLAFVAAPNFQESVSTDAFATFGTADRIVEVRSLPARPQFPAEEPTPSAWDENIAPVANIYPSIPDCGRALAAKLAKQLQKTKRSPDELRKAEKIKELQSLDEQKDELPKAEAEDSVKYRIALINQEDKLDNADFLNFVIKFRKQFTADFPGSLVEEMTREADSKATGTDDAEYKLLPVYVSKLGSKFHDNVRSGQIVCQFKRDDRGKIELVSDYVEKQWVADPGKFMAQNAGQNLFVGLSPRLASSQQEARLAAFKDAEIQLATSTGKTFQRNHGLNQYSVDQFAQKLTMPYGIVWRAAVMVDSSRGPYVQYGDKSDAIRVVRHTNSSTTTDRRLAAAVPVAVADTRSRPNPESILAGLILLTVVIGWISNWMTQGYYRGPVWTVTGTLFSIGFLFLIFIVLINFA